MAYLMVDYSYDFKGIDTALEREIATIVGRPHDDSGCGFGVRDLGWAQVPEGHAAELKTQIERAVAHRPAVHKISVSLTQDDGF
jgi:hypothetical protein